jgi:acyl-CoA synthetase (AMP-forming)/AMP-acid ligase II
MSARTRTANELLAEEFGTISDLIRAYAVERPAAVALVKDAERLSYTQLNQLMDRVTAALQQNGLRMGDVIAICAKTSIEYCGVFLGALRAGVGVAPIPPTATPQIVMSMTEDSDAKILFLDATVVGALECIEPAKAVKYVVLDGLSPGQSLRQWLTPAEMIPLPVVVGPNEVFNIIYSSGTTGEPKGIVHSHRMRWMQLRAVAAAFSYSSSSVTIVSTPLYSNTTLVSLFPTLGYGGCAVLMGKFEPAGFLALAEKHRVTHAMLVPVQYRRIMAVPDFDRYDLSSFVMKTSTSAPFEAKIKADVLRRWPGGLIEGYGLTEGGGACFLAAHLHPNKLHTVGKPAPGSDIRIIDEEGREVPPGQVGEIVGHSLGIMNGYHRRPKQTAEAEWYDASGKRFIRTGDVGRFDEDGFLILMDRRKDMIISGGFNIYPSDLESVLLRHDAVSEAAVVGIPSERWGETPVAFVVLKAGHAVAAEEIRDLVNEQVGKTQRVAAVVIVPTLPRSAIGKVLKRELREKYGRTASQ